MGKIESRWRNGVTRRQALVQLAGMLASSPLLAAQQDPRPLKDHRRVPGINEMLTPFDFEPVCFANMKLSDYDYMAHGTDSEFTLRRNRDAFDWVQLIQKPGTSAAALNTATTVLGLKMEYPIMIAPTASQVALHPDAEGGMYKGATAAKTPMIVSNVSSFPIERIAAASDGPKWCQFYPVQSIDASKATLERFQAAGAQAIVVTVDQQATRFERDLHDRNLGGNPRLPTAPPRPGAAPPPQGPALYRISANRLWYTWDYIDKIRPFVKVPILIKGILTAEDARLCVEHGMDGVIVSNHGGRSLDYGPSTLEVLPEIVDAVGARTTVLFDSGVRRGGDIVKAMALGARAVCIGRASRWALGAFGAPGVQRVLEIFQTEFRDAMAATGRTSLAQLDRTVVRTDFP